MATIVIRILLCKSKTITFDSIILVGNNQMVKMDHQQLNLKSLKVDDVKVASLVDVSLGAVLLPCLFSRHYHCESFSYAIVRPLSRSSYIADGLLCQVLAILYSCKLTSMLLCCIEGIVYCRV